MRWTVPLIAAALVARMAWFMNRFAVNVFTWDQWDFLRGFFTDENLWTLFRQQHGPHRQGLAAPLLSVIYGLSHFSSRVEAFTILGVLVVSAVLMLLLKRRLFGESPFDAGIFLLFLTLQSYDTLTQTPNPAHGPLPMLLVVCIAWAFTLRWHVALVLLAFLAMHTGFALFAALLVPIIAAKLAWKEKNRRMAMAALASTLAVATFFIDYAHQPAIECYRFPDPRPYLYPGFAGLMLAHAFATLRVFWLTAGIGFALGLSEIAFVCYAGWRWLKEGGDAWRTIFFLSAFTVTFAYGTAIGRVCAGLAGAFPSRYALYSVPFFLALYLGTYLLSRGQRAARMLWFAAMLYKEIDITEPLQLAQLAAQKKRAFAECYLRTNDLNVCDPRETIYPDPDVTNLQGKLDYLKAHDASFFRSL